MPGLKYLTKPLRQPTHNWGKALDKETVPVEREQSNAMRLSVRAGFLMLLGKGGAYWVTGSAAILSDAAESVIHIGAVFFAALSLYLIQRRPRVQAPYGYDRIAFLSAGFEGGMNIFAAIWIIATAIAKWIAGIQLSQLGFGTLVVLAAAVINLALGWHLVGTGRKHHSVILEANGLHVLTDSWTSFGVVAGLLLVILTGWQPFDPICAIAVALNILWSGGGLIRRSFRGLMDLPDPLRAGELRQAVETACTEIDATYHRLRFRDTGRHTIVSLHLLLPFTLTLGEAHRRATAFEKRLSSLLPYPLEVAPHLEAKEDHDAIHFHEPIAWS